MKIPYRITKQCFSLWNGSSLNLYHETSFIGKITTSSIQLGTAGSVINVDDVVFSFLLLANIKLRTVEKFFSNLKVELFTLY